MPRLSWVFAGRTAFCWFCHEAVHFVPCGGCIKTVYQDSSFFCLFCIYNSAICKAECGNKPSSDAEKTWATSWENLFMSYSEQQRRSLFSAFAVRCLDSIVTILAKSKISRLPSLCNWAGWFEYYHVANPEDRFSRVAAYSLCLMHYIIYSCRCKTRGAGGSRRKGEGDGRKREGEGRKGEGEGRKGEGERREKGREKGGGEEKRGEGEGRKGGGRREKRGREKGEREHPVPPRIRYSWGGGVKEVKRKRSWDILLKIC